MNKKVKALVGSALAIAMSASVATGATFALFTDKAEVNVAITAGRVDVEAEVSDLKLYSMDKYMGDNALEFENGGTAQLDGNNISLVNIAPGDKIEFNLALTNNSNIKTKIRTIITETGKDNGLLAGLKVFVNGLETNLKNGALKSSWTTVEPNANIEGGTMKVVIEFPVDKGDEYMETSTELRFAVEAVQWNAQVESDEENNKLVINSKSELIEFANKVNAGSSYAGWKVYLNTNVDFNGESWNPINGFKGTFDGQGYVVSNFVVNVDGNFAGLFGNSYGTIKNVAVDNAYITGKHWVGGIVAYSYGSVTGCSVTNSTIVGVDATLNDGDKVGGIVGQIMEKGQGTEGYTVSDNTVKNVLLVANRDVGGIAGALAREQNANIENNKVENVDIYYQVKKDYAEAGEIISQRKAITVSNSNKASDVTITKLTEGAIVVFNKAQLLALSGKEIEGTVELIADIDMANAEFKSIAIGRSKALTFNGNGHTIKNVKVGTGSHNGMSAHGLFYVHGDFSVSNLTVDNAVVDATMATNGYSRNYGAAVLIGYADANSMTNITNVDIMNSSVVNDSDEGAIYVSYATGTQNITDCDMTNCTVQGETAEKTGAFVGCANGVSTITNCTKDIDLNWCNRIENAGILVVDGFVFCNNDANVEYALSKGYTQFYLNAGTYAFTAQNKNNLVFNGTKDAIIIHTQEGNEGGADYSFDGSTVTMNGITIKNNQGISYPGYARAQITFNKCTFDGTYGTYANTTFNECTFNVTGDAYNLWTWGAEEVTLNDCTLNSDGKSLLLYGQVNTKLTVNNCKFYDNGTVEYNKAAIEIGNDYNKSYTLIVNNATVEGFAINNVGINTNTTLWANKNSMSTDVLNVVVDGVDVY